MLLNSWQNFDQHVANLEISDLFLSKGKAAAPFLKKLQPYLGGRPIDFSFMVRFNVPQLRINDRNLNPSSMYVLLRQSRVHAVIEVRRIDVGLC